MGLEERELPASVSVEVVEVLNSGSVIGTVLVKVGRNCAFSGRCMSGCRKECLTVEYERSN